MPLFPILIIYFIWRLLILFFLNPMNLFVYGEEELYRGWIGKEILAGLKIPFFDYRADDYSGGSFLIGGLSALFFKIFGMTAFALKLIPVFFFAGALAAWYLWLSKFLNRRIATVFSLLFIFSPYLFTRFSLTTLGDHPETIFFTAVSVYFFFQMLATPGRAVLYAALMGLLSGVGLWMAYIYVITIFSIIIYWVFIDPKFYRRREFFITAVFFCAGFSPWLWANISNGFLGLEVQGIPLQNYFHWKFLMKRFLDFRSSSFYRIFEVHQLPGFVPELSPLWVTRFYRFMYAVPLLLFFWKERFRMKENLKKWQKVHSPVLFSGIFLAVFILISQTTEFRETRYYIPAQPFLVFLAVYAVDRITERFAAPSKVFLRRLYAGLLILASLCLHATGFYPEYRGALFSMKPHHFYWFLLSPVCRTPERCLETYQRFGHKDELAADEISMFRSGVAQKLLEAMPFEEPEKSLMALKARSPAELHKYYDYYFGYETAARNDYDLRKTLQLLQKGTASKAFSYGLAVSGIYREPFPVGNNYSPSLEEWHEVGSVMPPELLGRYWRARGFQWSDYFFLKSHDFHTLIKEASELARNLTSEERVSFFQGIGHYAFDHWKADPFRHHPLWDEPFSFSQEFQNWILQGAGTGIASQFFIFDYVYTQTFLGKFTAGSKAEIQKGIDLRAEYSRKFFPAEMI